jgi:hypothetical protein
MVHNHQARREVKRLAQVISEARQDRRALETARDQQRVMLERNEAELAERGHLPDRAPVETYFRTLSAMALEHNVRVVRYNPLATRQYTGLLERRYAYEVTGSLPDLVRFLQAIEDTEYWADVSYMKLERGVGTEEVAANSRVAVLTISLFTTPQEDVSPQGGGA